MENQEQDDNIPSVIIGGVLTMLVVLANVAIVLSSPTVARKGLLVACYLAAFMVLEPLIILGGLTLHYKHVTADQGERLVSCLVALHAYNREEVIAVVNSHDKKGRDTLIAKLAERGVTIPQADETTG